MTDKSTFEKVTQSQKILYGPRKLLLCGFGAESQKKFETVLGRVGLTDAPRVWITAAQDAALLAELLELPGDSGAGISSTLPRAVIVAGITQTQLISLMTVCKKSGMQQTLWAVLTPVSEKWTLAQLLAELARERDALQKKNSESGAGHGFAL